MTAHCDNPACRWEKTTTEVVHPTVLLGVGAVKPGDRVETVVDHGPCGAVNSTLKPAHRYSRVLLAPKKDEA